LSSLIRAQNLSFSRGGKTIVDKVSLDLQRKQILTLIGPNGAGKTTLVRLLLGLIKPDSGEVIRSGTPTVGYMPQKLFIDATMPLNVRRFLALTGASEDAIRRALGRVGMAEHGNSRVVDLSGGELQRVLLARAIARKPDVLVLDEPVQGVDVAGQTQLYQLITALRDELSAAVLMISHDLHLVMAQTDQVVCLNQHVCCHGHPDNVSEHPAYLELFGQPKDAGVSVYTHHHDHQH
jgi:zinc transport system ATP-binding protein